MKQWVVRTVVVAAVFGGFFLGRGLRAAAEVPSGKPAVFGCGYSDSADGVPQWLNSRCDPSKSFTVEHYLVSSGTGEEYYMCCIRK